MSQTSPTANHNLADVTSGLQLYAIIAAHQRDLTILLVGFVVFNQSSPIHAWRCALISSYQLSERISVHCILFYGLALPIYRGAVAIENAWRFIRAALPTLLFAVGLVAKALGLTAVCVVVAAAVACIPPVFWLGLAIVAAFGWLTYPRTRAVKP